MMVFSTCHPAHQEHFCSMTDCSFLLCHLFSVLSLSGFPPNQSSLDLLAHLIFILACYRKSWQHFFFQICLGKRETSEGTPPSLFAEGFAQTATWACSERLRKKKKKEKEKYFLFLEERKRPATKLWNSMVAISCILHFFHSKEKPTLEFQ